MNQIEIFVAVYATFLLVLMSMTRIAAYPTPINKELLKNDYEIDYTLRNWGESTLPYSISYSQHARDLYFSSTKSPTVSSTQSSQSRVKRVQGRRIRKNRTTTLPPSTTSTEKHFYMPLLFGSDGWGPSS